MLRAARVGVFRLRKWEKLNVLLNFLLPNLAKSGPESVVLESSVKPSQACQFGKLGLVWQKIQEPLTFD